jgi:hypothetical protein
MAILPKAIYRFNTIPIKIPMKFIIEIEKPKVHLETQKTMNTKTILSKKTNAAGITIPNFKLYYRAIAIKAAWEWHKNRYEEQQNRIEDLDMNPHSCTHLIFNKDDKKKKKDGEKTASSTTLLGKVSAGYLPAEN